MKNQIKEAALSYADQLKDYRRYLHVHPETSFHETETSAWIKERLDELGIPTMDHIRKNSIVGYIEGNADGPVIAFRADIDALPIQEENDIPFKSQTPNVMHACGHDAHTSTLLCFADYLQHHPELIKGKVLFIFQQAEELLPGGAQMLIEDGVLDGVDAIFGWHIGPENQLGELVIAPGPRTAAITTYHIDIQGKGGHGASPHAAVNPIAAATLIANAINSITTLNIDAYDTAVVTVSYLIAGNSGVFNIIPDTAVMGGNMRTFNDDLIEVMSDRIEKIAHGICAAQNCTCAVEISRGYPTVLNDEAIVEKIMPALNTLGYEIFASRPVMASEDFARYLLKVPGAFMTIGTTNPEKPETLSFPHHPKLMIDEGVMDVAFEALLAIYLQMTDQMAQ